MKTPERVKEIYEDAARVCEVYMKRMGLFSLNMRQLEEDLLEAYNIRAGFDRVDSRSILFLSKMLREFNNQKVKDLR